MISSPQTWKEFFQIYYTDEVNKLAGKVMNNSSDRSIYVNFQDLMSFRGGVLARELINNPEKVIEDAQNGLAGADNIFDVRLENCFVRFVNLTFKKSIDEIRCDTIGKFVAVEGIVRKATEVKPRLSKVVFECSSCGKTLEVEVEPSLTCNKLPKPQKCDCGSRTLKLSNKSQKIDSQRLRLQSFPEHGQPQSIDILIEGDIAGKLSPGNRVIINGIVKDEFKNKFYAETVYIYANSFEILQKDFEEIKITQEDVEKVKEISKSDNVRALFVKSIAPSIYGHDDIKLAIALQLFGGVPKKLPDGTETRGDIHILLVGDPGSAKSKLIKYVYRIAPRSVLVTGKGASVAGLTATTVRDEIDGRWTVEAGALILADKGICVIDEFDKMRKEDRDALHDALEDQIIAINKAGINVTFRTRCSVLAAANPKFSRFDRYTPIADQIDLPASLLSRFDLIFVITDNPDEDFDKNVSRQIVTNHRTPEDVKPAIDPDLLRKYVAYAKRTVFPVLSDEAAEHLTEFYVRLRSKAKENSPVPITARQLEAIIRLAEASARMRLSDTVEPEDVRLAIKLLLKSLEQIALDPETGEIDIDYLEGTPKSVRDISVTILKIIEELEDTTNYGAPEDEIIKIAEDKGFSQAKILDTLQKLRERGSVFCPRPKHYRIVRW